jgi:hypothetical protein
MGAPSFWAEHKLRDAGGISAPKLELVSCAGGEETSYFHSKGSRVVNPAGAGHFAGRGRRTGCINGLVQLENVSQGLGSV